MKVKYRAAIESVDIFAFFFSSIKVEITIGNDGLQITKLARE